MILWNYWCKVACMLLATTMSCRMFDQWPHKVFSSTITKRIIWTCTQSFKTDYDFLRLLVKMRVRSYLCSTRLAKPSTWCEGWSMIGTWTARAVTIETSNTICSIVWNLWGFLNLKHCCCPYRNNTRVIKKIIYPTQTMVVLFSIMLHQIQFLPCSGNLSQLWF